MIKAILFDLDGTLLQMDQKEFIDVYMRELTKKLAPLGFAPEQAVKALWAGTAAMVKNDGSRTNRERFWETFFALLDVPASRLPEIEAVTDAFYATEFNRAEAVVHRTECPKQIVTGLLEKGYRLILATNPLFPPEAVQSRLRWAGLDSAYFERITHYKNSRYCKPSPLYYQEILEAQGLKPEDCMMVGNNLTEDMCAQTLGMRVYLVTDYLEGEGDKSAFLNGSLLDFYAYSRALAPLGGGR